MLKHPPKFAPGDIVRHVANHAERYRMMLVLDTTIWAVRESDGEEVMFLIENLIRP